MIRTKPWTNASRRTCSKLVNDQAASVIYPTYLIRGCNDFDSIKNLIPGPLIGPPIYPIGAHEQPRLDRRYVVRDRLGLLRRQCHVRG